MKLTTRLAIRKHKNQSSHKGNVVRIGARTAPYGVTYTCSYCARGFVTEKRVNKALVALQKQQYAK